MIPDNDYQTLSFLMGHIQQALYKCPCLLTIGLTLAEVEIDLISILSHRSKAGQSLLLLMATSFALNQTKWPFVGGPGVGCRLSKARKPALILVKQQPVLVGRCQSLQPVTTLFFSA